MSESQTMWALIGAVNLGECVWGTHLLKGEGLMKPCFLKLTTLMRAHIDLAIFWFDDIDFLGIMSNFHIAFIWCGLDPLWKPLTQHK